MASQSRDLGNSGCLTVRRVGPGEAGRRRNLSHQARSGGYRFLNFSVRSHIPATTRALQNIREIGKNADESSVAVVYLHGCQVFLATAKQLLPIAILHPARTLVTSRSMTVCRTKFDRPPGG